MLTKEDREELRRIAVLMKEAVAKPPTDETLTMLAAAPATVNALLDALDEVERDRDEWKARAERAEAERRALIGATDLSGTIKALRATGVQSYAVAPDDIIDIFPNASGRGREALAAARGEIATDNKLLAQRDNFIAEVAALVGGCSVHGDTCMPHLRTALVEMKRERDTWKARFESMERERVAAGKCIGELQDKARAVTLSLARLVIGNLCLVCGPTRPLNDVSSYCVCPPPL